LPAAGDLRRPGGHLPIALSMAGFMLERRHCRRRGPAHAMSFTSASRRPDRFPGPDPDAANGTVPRASVSSSPPARATPPGSTLPRSRPATWLRLHHRRPRRQKRGSCSAILGAVGRLEQFVAHPPRPGPPAAGIARSGVGRPATNFPSGCRQLPRPCVG
jgi:hypothetical protein